MLNIPQEGPAIDASTFGVNLADRAASRAHLRLLEGGGDDNGPIQVETAQHELAPSDVSRHGRFQRKAKRAVDVAVAGCGLAVLWPAMMLIAIAVKSTSRGGVIFSHERIGRDGKPFKMYKFRSMRAGTDERIKQDPELLAYYQAHDFKLPPSDLFVTPVGRFLRKSSLDELPQLWNVLGGDMSLVGIRPLEFDQLVTRGEKDQDLYKTMQPGLTGLWQVVGRSTISGDERVELDRRYVNEWSFWSDVRILLRTPVAVLRPKNTH